MAATSASLRPNSQPRKARRRSASRTSSDNSRASGKLMAMIVTSTRQSDDAHGISEQLSGRRNSDCVAPRSPTQTDSFHLLNCSSPVIDRVYRDRLVSLEGGSQKPLDVYFPREEGDFLYSVVRHLRPELTVEVGMA